jgi:P27 family predicted phage terminase small subunit
MDEISYSKHKVPHAPKNIRPEAKQLWKQVHQDWEVDPAGQEILRVAVISLSRFLEAREIIDREGATYTTPTGQIKKHPALEVEKASRMGFLACMRELGLDYDDEPKRGPGRPAIGLGCS